MIAIDLVNSEPSPRAKADGIAPAIVANDVIKIGRNRTLPALVIAARDIGEEMELQHYLSPTLKDGLPDPSEMKNLSLAAAKIIFPINPPKP